MSNRRGRNSLTSIVVDTDDRAFSRPDREQEPDREFNRNSERAPLDVQNLYSIEERAGYRRAAVPDLPGNVQRYERAGWKVVTSAAVNTADEHGRATNQVDSVVRVTLNLRPDARWHSAVIMEIPLEYWDEDEERRLQEIYRREESFDPGKYKQKGFDATYGHLKRGKKYF